MQKATQPPDDEVWELYVEHYSHFLPWTSDIGGIGEGQIRAKALWHEMYESGY